MSTVKITDLTALTDPSNTDILPIVSDPSGTSAATKKVTIKNLLENAGSGSAATPGISFDGDPDTGIARLGANNIAICTNGTARISIDAVGDVIIPNNLTVEGTTTFIDSQTLRIEDKNIELGVVSTPTNTTADGGGITLKGATDKTITWVNSTGAWTFNQPVNMTGGNVGIGNTVPRGLLHVGPDLASGATDAARINLKQNGLAATDGIYLERSGERRGYHMFIGAPSDGLTFRANNFGTVTTTMYLDRSGKVGINNTAPGNQGANFNNLVVGSTSGNNGITILTGSNNDGIINFNNADDSDLTGYLIYEHSTDSLRFGTAGTGDKMRIDEYGKVGIGFPAEQAPLEVQGQNAFASAASTLATAATKAAFRVKGSNNSSDSLWMGTVTTNAEPYIQGANGIGSASKDLLLNPFGGDVGIGTVNPGGNLTVTDAATYTLDVKAIGGGTNGVKITTLGSSAHLTFGTDDTERLRITSTGNAEFGGAVQVGDYISVDTTRSGTQPVFIVNSADGNDRALINANGAATFAAGGCTISQYGHVTVKRTDDDDNVQAFEVQNAAGSTTTKLFGNGAAEFGGNITTGPVTVNSTVRYTSIGNNFAVGSTTGYFLAHYGTGNTVHIGLKNDGSASFAGSDFEIDATGQLTIKKSTPFTDPSFRILDRNNSNANGVLMYGNGAATFAGGNLEILGDGLLRVKRSTGNGSGGLLVYPDNDFNANASAVINTDGSATFAGNVGIGETTPNTKLVVKDASNGLTDSVGNINVISSDSAAVDKGGSIGLGGFYNGTSNSIPFANIHGKKENGTDNNADGYFAISTRNASAGTVERVRVDSDGRVGIGKTSSLSAKLHIQDDSATETTLIKLRNYKASVNTQAGILFECSTSGNQGGNSLIKGVCGTDAGGSNSQNDGGLAFQTGSGGSGTLSTRMLIQSDGHVLIGGTSTADNDHAHIDANGTLTIRRTNATDVAIDLVEDGTVSSRIYADGLFANYNVGSSAYTAFDNESGVSGPYAALGAFGGEARVTAGSTASNDVPLVFRTADGGTETERMRIASSGLVSAPGVYSFTTASSANVIVESAGQLSRATSSIKYKRNIETLEDSYADAILNCRPVWYQSKSELDNPDHGFWGFIAEEVAEIDPRLVQWKTNEITYDENGSSVATPCEPEAESVAYDRFVPHLLNIVKRQQATIESLETRIAALDS